jgi:hypothetical protein
MWRGQPSCIQGILSREMETRDLHAVAVQQRSRFCTYVESRKIVRDLVIRT